MAQKNLLLNKSLNVDEHGRGLQSPLEVFEEYMLQSRTGGRQLRCNINISKISSYLFIQIIII